MKKPIIFLLALCLGTVARADILAKVERRGEYLPSGDYAWNYAVVVATDDSDPKEALLDLDLPADLPFRLEGLPRRVTVSVDESERVDFRIIVPVSYVVSPRNLETYPAELSVSTAGIKRQKRMLALRGPLPEHPRLLITAGELPQLRRRLEHPDLALVRQTLERQAAAPLDGMVANDRPSEKVRAKMEALALKYLAYGDQAAECGDQAVGLAIDYLASIQNTSGYWGNVHAYEAVMGAAMVYDWCHDRMDERQMKALNREMKRVCSISEYSYPGRASTDFFSGHYGEHAPTVFLAMGIATFDEDPELFDFAYDQQINGFIPSRNPMYKAGAHHQGSQYMHARYVHELLQALMLEKLGVEGYDPAITDLSYKGMYLRIPQRTDMDGMPDGDCHNDIYMGYQGYFLSAGMSKDPFQQYFARMFLPKQLDQSARLFLYYDPEVRAASPDSLCLSRFFPSPSGIMMARTAWDVEAEGYDSDVLVVQMNMKEYNARNHDHSDAGHFGIYYKGHLALDSGIYQGTDPENGWGKANFVNYYTRTVAHNSILVLDPQEPLPYGGGKRRAEARDGGQFVMKPDAWRHSREMFAQGKVAPVLAHEIATGISPDYTYLKGDMTRAYCVPDYISPDYPAKVDTVRRSFVFLNRPAPEIPGVLIVLDKVVARDPSFRKSWLLHTQQEPRVEGVTIVASNTTGGRNGKLHTTLLLPEEENLRIEKIGGPGREYWVDGRNWGNAVQEDAGCWRIEAGFRQASKSDNYLAVIQVMQASPSPDPLPIRQTVSRDGAYRIVEVGDRIVAQQLRLDRQEGRLEFSLGDNARTYRVLVADLEPGTWIVRAGGKRLEREVTPDAGTLYFTAAGGRFVLEKRA